MKVRKLEQLLEFNATPEQIYEILMNSRSHAQLIDADVQITDQEGVEFKMWGGSIHGRNIKLRKPGLIVQEWRADDEVWPMNHFSTVTYRLDPLTGDKTSLTFTHENIPVQIYEDVKHGWIEYYWKPLAEKFPSQK